jgi:hypothetical protein
LYATSSSAVLIDYKQDSIIFEYQRPVTASLGMLRRQLEDMYNEGMTAKLPTVSQEQSVASLVVFKQASAQPGLVVS